MFNWQHMRVAPRDTLILLIEQTFFFSAGGAGDFGTWSHPKQKTKTIIVQYACGSILN